MKIIERQSIFLYVNRKNETVFKEEIYLKSSLNVEFLENKMKFINYPFKASDIYFKKEILLSEIEVCIENFIPPVIQTKKKELLFISAVQKEPLLQFCKKSKIPVIQKNENWADILEIFLDIDVTKEELEICYKRLKENGISKELCDRIRKEVCDKMIAYNFSSCLWEWVHLGLYDVLEASLGILSGKKYCMEPKEFQKFYWEAMKIEFMGKNGI